MSEYQVIARKWRPRCFADVVGQEHVVRTLRNAILNQRTAHAYLFVGPRGIGKTTLARIFAKAMNCENPQNGEPCCQCESCKAIMEERSLDVIEVDAASRNSTGDMRELSEDVLTRPVGGRYKIYIIDEVHMLSKAAWNVLLKTVEEPPSHVKFIFATTEVHQVLPTIISRCQRFDLQPIPTHLIAERLKLIASTEKVAIADEAINAIARAAEGGMRDAQSLLDQMIAFFAAGDGSAITGEQVLSLFGLTDAAEMDAIIAAMFANDPGQAVLRVGSLAKRGKNLETLYDDLLAVLWAVHLCSILQDPSALLDEGAEAVERYRKLAQMVPPDTIQILLETLSPVGRVLHDALNKQVYLETVLLKAMREAHAVRIGDLLARLNQLRSAGELKFLDQLPPVEKKISLPPLPPVPAIPVAESKPVEVKAPPAVEIKPVEVKAPPAVEIQPPDVKALPPVVENPPADPLSADPEERVCQPEPVKEELTPAPPEIPVDPEEDCDDVPLPETAIVFDDKTVSSDNAAEKNPETMAPEAEGHERRSIANDHPEALTEAEKDPQVRDVMDLFSGMVVDIHR